MSVRLSEQALVGRGARDAHTTTTHLRDVPAVQLLRRTHIRKDLARGEAHAMHTQRTHISVMFRQSNFSVMSRQSNVSAAHTYAEAWMVRQWVLLARAGSVPARVEACVRLPLAG
jgi:hypothetical protein